MQRMQGQFYQGQLPRTAIYDLAMQKLASVLLNYRQINNFFSTFFSGWPFFISFIFHVTL